MNLVTLRPILAPLFGIAICFAASPRPGATVREMPIAARFVATAVSEAGVVGGRIDILIQHWSTDEEWDSFRGTLMKSGPGKLLPVLQQIRREAGVLLMPGVQGLGARARERKRRVFQIARTIDTPAGRRILVATDESLGFGERIVERSPVEPEVTLLEMRFDGDGNGTGKLAPAMKIVYDQKTKLVELDDYASQPVRLSDIRSEDISLPIR
jgi:hypothetical protein